jgi:hypothetical protein
LDFPLTVCIYLDIEQVGKLVDALEINGKNDLIRPWKEIEV